MLDRAMSVGDRVFDKDGREYEIAKINKATYSIARLEDGISITVGKDGTKKSYGFEVFIHPVIHHTVFTIDVPEEECSKGTVLRIHRALKKLGVLELTKIDGYSKRAETKTNCWKTSKSNAKRPTRGYS